MLEAWDKSYALLYFNQEKKFLKFFAPKKVIQHDSWDSLNKNLSQISIDKNYFHPRFFFLPYDVNPRYPLEIEFSRVEEFKFLSPGIPLDLRLNSYLSFEDYFHKFKKVYQSLKRGDAYQLNLTFPFSYSWEKDLTPNDFLWNLWSKRENGQIAAYAHALVLEGSDPSKRPEMFISNSPECLFQLYTRDGRHQLISRPIKGSLPWKNKNELVEVWQGLKDSKKNQAELYMIADLVRNDLTKIEQRAAKIIKKKLPLIVPGIVHQYAEVMVELSKSVTWDQVMTSLFPGGSITGAPKKKAIELLQKIEVEKRQLYSGSTLVLHKTLKAASINIRSANINFEKRTLSYQAGGGVTLLSNPLEEYREVLHKVDSFIRLLNE